MGGKTGTKAVYFDKLKALLDEYKSIFIVSQGQGQEADRPVNRVCRSAWTMSRRNRCTKSASPFAEKRWF